MDESLPPSYEEVVKSDVLPSYDDVLKEERCKDCCLYLLIGIIFMILLIGIPVLLALKVDKNE